MSFILQMKFFSKFRPRNIIIYMNRIMSLNQQLNKLIIIIHNNHLNNKNQLKSKSQRNSQNNIVTKIDTIPINNYLKFLYKNTEENQEEHLCIQIPYQVINGGNQTMQMKDLKEQDPPIIIISMMPLQETLLKISEELEMTTLLFTMQSYLQLDITLDSLLKITKEIMFNIKMKMKIMNRFKMNL